MNNPQKQLLVGVMVLSSILLLLGINVLDVDDGKLRTTLTFVFSPLLIVGAKFILLGARELRVKYLQMDGLLVLAAIILHLALTDYTGNTYGSPEIIEDKLRPEPGVSIWIGKWFGLVVPCILALIVIWRLIDSSEKASEESPEKDRPVE